MWMRESCFRLMVSNGIILGRWGASTGIGSGPERSVPADPRLVQPTSGASRAPCAAAALRMFESRVGLCLPLGWVLASWKTQCDVLPTAWMSQKRIISEYFGKQERHALLVIKKISKWLLSWAFKDFDYKFWYSSNRLNSYSVLSSGYCESYGNVKIAL